MLNKKECLLAAIVLCPLLFLLNLSRSSPNDTPYPTTKAYLPQACNNDILRNAYLNTIRDVLTGMALRTVERTVPWDHGHDVFMMNLSMIPRINIESRKVGLDWPLFGMTMIGNARMDNVRTLLEKVEELKIPGDFMECGCWRGGASIFAKAVLDSMGELSSKRHVWVADSFEGLPLPRAAEFSKDSPHWEAITYLRVSLEDVRMNFEAFGVLDETVHFCKGFFCQFPTNVQTECYISVEDGWGYV